MSCNVRQERLELGLELPRLTPESDVVVQNLFTFFLRQSFDMNHYLGFMNERKSGYLQVISCRAIDVVARCEQNPSASTDCCKHVWEYPIPADRARPIELCRTEGIVHPKELLWLMRVRVPNKVIGVTDFDGRASPLIQRTYS